jgi:hypothetical protein
VLKHLLRLLLKRRVRHRIFFRREEAHLLLLFGLLHSCCQLAQQSALGPCTSVVVLRGVPHWLLIAAVTVLISCNSWLKCSCRCLAACHDSRRLCCDSCYCELLLLLLLLLVQVNAIVALCAVLCCSGHVILGYHVCSSEALLC